MNSLLAGLFLGALGGLLAASVWPRIRRHRLRRKIASALRTRTFPSDPTKRALITGAVGGAIGAAGIAATKPSKAFADISFGELVRGVREGATDALQDVLGGLIELWFTVLRVIQFPTPGRIIHLINEILGLLESSDSTYVGADPAEPLERSYPTVPILTPEEQAAATMQRAIDTRSRVDQAMRVNGAVAQVQGELAIEEEAIRSGAYASGEFGLVGFVIAQMEEQHRTNLRLGQQSQQLAQIAQLLGDLVMKPVNDAEQGVMAKEAFIAGSGDAIAPPVEHPVP